MCVDNEQLKSSSEKKISCVPIVKNKIYKKLEVLHNYKKMIFKTKWLEFLSKLVRKIVLIFFFTFDRDSRQQVQFLAKYPLLDSQSDRELTFSYMIPRQILLFDRELKQQRRKR